MKYSITHNGNYQEVTKAEADADKAKNYDNVPNQKQWSYKSDGYSITEDNVREQLAAFS